MRTWGRPPGGMLKNRGPTLPARRSPRLPNVPPTCHVPRIPPLGVERQQRVYDVAHVPLATRLPLLLHEGLLGIVEVLLPHVARQLYVVRVAPLSRRPSPPAPGPATPARPAREHRRAFSPVPQHAVPQSAEPARSLAHLPSNTSWPTAS